MANGDSAGIEDLRQRVEELERAVDGYTPGQTRRQILKGGAAAAAAGTFGFGVGTASADASTSDSDGDIGTPSNRVDAFLDGADASNVVTEEMVIEAGRGFIGLPVHHINYQSGLSNEEIGRFTLDSGNVLEVWRLEVKLKGGGTNGSFSVDVYDATNSTVLASTSAKTTGGTTPLGTSGSGATVLVRLNNSTGSAQDACITGITNIVKA